MVENMKVVLALNEDRDGTLPSNYFESKLVLLDITDFSVKLQNKFECSRKEPLSQYPRPLLERMSGLFGSFSMISSTEETKRTKGNNSQLLQILVGLPSVEYREMILKTLLAKEKHKNLDFKELATMTEGYTGSDLKNLCITAAYRPVRELRQQERMKDMEKKKREAEGQSSEDASNNKDKEEQEITLTPSNMEDMRRAKSQVR
ncbi:hypothetical protein GYH30_033514 [Glycine max]|uniref:AAA ATPase AAA+ lid domain-containing protein n=3 Tax=Glycine subgen. Soja TaxID=1462606 RepID=A0A0R0H4L9_SOYBN|nr:hypothetical protein JHK87_033513 [Glycine soja]KAH1142854.1 hypothetical protein GYH30_033514 [Glycine max]RZB75534.1 hypothetical protein D0Y65_034122 [Glycine soja]